MDMNKLNIVMLSAGSSVSVLAVQPQILSLSSQAVGNNSLFCRPSLKLLFHSSLQLFGCYPCWKNALLKMWRSKIDAKINNTGCYKMNF